MSPMLSVDRLVVGILLSSAAIAVAAPPVSRSPSDAAPLTLSGSADPPSVARDDAAERPLLESVARERRLIAAQVQAEVDNQLQGARARLSDDPASVSRELKLSLERIALVPELTDEERSSLRIKLTQALREARRRLATRQAADAQAQAARAANQDRLQIAGELARDQQKLKQLIDRFDALLDEDRHAAAYQVASLHVSEVAPDAPVASSAREVAAEAGAHRQNMLLRAARQQAVVATLATVETSLAPFADDEPVVYPRDWQERTLRRAKYARTDLGTVGPAEARIRQQLAQPTTMEFIDTSLEEVVDYLKDLHGIEIQLDARALADAGIGSSTPITLSVDGVSLRSGLRLMLRPLELSYVVKDEVLLVTTAEAAANELVTKVYPVEDLVVPIGPPGGGLGSIGSITGSGAQQAVGVGSGPGNGGPNPGFPGANPF